MYMEKSRQGEKFGLESHNIKFNRKSVLISSCKGQKEQKPNQPLKGPNDQGGSMLVITQIIF